jgi:hypothetical protein
MKVCFFKIFYISLQKNMMVGDIVEYIAWAKANNQGPWAA